jgi:hypothetical protein
VSSVEEGVGCPVFSVEEGVGCPVFSVEEGVGVGVGAALASGACGRLVNSRLRVMTGIVRGMIPALANCSCT